MSQPGSPAIGSTCPVNELPETAAHASTETSSETDGSSSSDWDTSSEVSFCGRLYVFATLSLGVQTFLSYSGGATPMTVTAIQQSGDWTGFEVSLLGALDKIGQVIAAPFWGLAMQHFPAKRLLTVSLLSNAIFSLQFGHLANKYSMCFSKFMQGCTESPNIVWGNLWTAMCAPPSQLSLWMNLGGVAAGVGTGIGTAVAGFSQSSGLSYSFAYTLQAACLCLLWIALVCTPARLVNLPSRRGRAPEIGRRMSSRLGQPRINFTRQILKLGSNGLYLFTMLNIGLVMFVSGGNQWYWPQFFQQGPWLLGGRSVTLSNLLVPAAGMGLGIFLGPRLIDAYGGYHDDLGRYVTLRLLWKVTGLGTFGSGLLILALSWRMSHNDQYDSTLFDPTLWGFWLATVPVNFSLSAQAGVQTVINLESVDSDMQEFAQGLTTSFQNLFGYAGGVIGPSLVSSASELFVKFLSRQGPEEPDLWTPQEWRSWQLSVAVVVLFLVVYVLFFTVGASQYVAKRRLVAIYRDK